MTQLVLTSFGIGMTIGLSFAFLGMAVSYAKALFIFMGRG